MFKTEDSNLYMISFLKTFGSLAGAVLLGAGSGLMAAEAPAIGQAWEQLKSYQTGRSRQPLTAIEAAVSQASAGVEQRQACAERLAGLLADAQIPLEARTFIAQQLKLVAGEGQLPILRRVLEQPETSALACLVLDALPGEAASEALFKALDPVLAAAAGAPRGEAPGASLSRETARLLGLIDSLGLRCYPPAMEKLAQIMADDAQPLPVRGAAVRALAQMGTAGAADLLLPIRLEDWRDQPGAQSFLANAWLVCAGRLAAQGGRETAGRFYEALWSGDFPVPLRLAGLAGLIQIGSPTALPAVGEALAAEDLQLCRGAARLSLLLQDPRTTPFLAGKLDGLPVPAQAALIEALAGRRDSGAAPAAARLLDSKDESVQLAAINALAMVGDARAAEPLVALAAGEKPALQAAARKALSRLPGADEALIRIGGREALPQQIEALRSLAERSSQAAIPLAIRHTRHAQPRLRTAAWEALSRLALAEHYPALVDLLGASTPEQWVAAAEAAVAAVGGRLADPAARLAPLLRAAPQARAQARASLLLILGQCGGGPALEAVRAGLTDADPLVSGAALRSLADWPDGAAAADLLKLSGNPGPAHTRSLALRGFLRLAQNARSAPMFRQAAQLAQTGADKKLLLGVLAEAPLLEAMEVAQPWLADPEVRAEAAMALIQIATPLARQAPEKVQAAMNQILKAVAEASLIRQAEAVLRRASASVDVLEPAPYGLAVLEARRKDLQATAKPGDTLAAYLDCGVEGMAKGSSAVVIRQLTGTPYAFPGSLEAARPVLGTIAFGSTVTFRISGLDPARHYALGFTWWDFDDGKRVQSAQAISGNGSHRQSLAEGIALPSYAGSRQIPALVRRWLDPKTFADGSVSITFANRSGPNTVVSEIALYETAQATPDAARTGPIRVLLVTGQEYPGHPWSQTAPALAEQLQKDSRLQVRTVEDPHFLDSEMILQYDVIVLHFMNWEQPAPGEKARENLRRAVENGKGLALVHFACGAWQDWPEFRSLAGRAWDPKLRGHDPRGPFRVEICNPGHPIGQGLKDFETDDELYTCLAGDRPIEIVAQARSKVDGKDYPMAFVLNYGKGRVFHCVLGHDAKALQPEGVGELYRRGCRWAAGD